MSPRKTARCPAASAALWAALAAGLVAGCGEPEPAAAETLAAPAPPAPEGRTGGEPPAGHAAEAPAPALPDLSDPSWNRVTSRGGTYVVCWRAVGGTIPRNADFTLEAWVLRDGQPRPDLFLDVNAWMPDHGHGMLRKPRAERQPDGSFRVEGMLLHMRGRWLLLFEMLENTIAETAEVALDL